MKLSDIDNFYMYHEVADGKKVTFGWIKADEALNAPLVVTTGSKSKATTELDSKWSYDEGTSAASVSCYIRYFEALTRDSPDVFLNTWSSDTDGLMNHVKTFGGAAGSGEFLLSLANLLLTGKKFSKFGRFFKIVNDLA